MKKKNILTLIEVLQVVLNSPIPMPGKLSRIKLYLTMSLNMIKNMLEMEEKQGVEPVNNKKARGLAS